MAINEINLGPIRSGTHRCSCNPKAESSRPDRVRHVKSCKKYKRRTKRKKSNRAVPGVRGSQTKSYRRGT